MIARDCERPARKGSIRLRSRGRSREERKGAPERDERLDRVNLGVIGVSCQGILCLILAATDSTEPIQFDARKLCQVETHKIDDARVGFGRRIPLFPPFIASP